MSTPLWTSAELATATGGTSAGAWNCTGLSIDSRSITPGDCFIPLKGPSFDGHDFIAGALDKGAAGALSERPIQNVPAERLVQVADSFAALQALGHASRRRSHTAILAVTGSAGKTGCKEALRQILSAQALTYASVGSFNNHWGVPLSLARMPRESRYGVFELGMNHSGELGPLSRMVAPHIAIITTIAPVHIGNFRDLDEIAAAKAELFEGVSPGGHVVINADNPYAAFLRERAAAAGIGNIHGFGLNGNAARLAGFTLGPESSDVRADIMGEAISYTVGAPGEHWVMNSLAALLGARLAGADLKQAAETLRHLRLAEGRGGAQPVALEGGSFTLVDESYNASPIAVEMAIKVLGRRTPAAGGRRLLALGDMKELGPEARNLHLALLPAIQEAKIDLVFACGEMMKHLFDALPPARRGAYAFTSAELAPLAAAAVRHGDIITVKGSHSVHMDKVVAALQSRSTSQIKKAV